ncbi:MAG: PqqD family protein [Bacteroidetes bacterium]|nr:MAG: PqqD family protein [Bacteroidota bacterium]
MSYKYNNLSMKLEINRHIAISETGLVLNPSTGDSFATNPIGLEILQILKRKTDYQEIQNYIISKYDVEVEVFQKDFQDFIICLRNYKIIKDI